MSTTAVTPGAPAASSATQDSEHSNFLPTGKNYRLTGELPARSSKTSADTGEAPAASTAHDADADTGEASAASESETAAASEAATTQKKGPAQSKTTQTTENRFQKLSRENRELRDRLARIESGQTAEPAAQRETQQASQPAPETRTATAPKSAPKPKIDDVDPKTGKAKYTSFAEWEEAKDQWLLDEGARRALETTQKTQQEQQRQHVERTLAEGMQKKFDAVRGELADFDKVALNPNLVIPRGSVADLFLLDSDHAGRVLYHLGQHPEILDGFYGDFDPKAGRYSNKITPQRQFRKLMEIEASLSKSGRARTQTAATSGEGDGEGEGETSSARPVTTAPRPPHQTSGKGSVQKDALAQAVEEGDQSTYAAEMNRRELERRKKGR